MTFLIFRIFDASESNRFRAGKAVSRNRQHLLFYFSVALEQRREEVGGDHHQHERLQVEVRRKRQRQTCG